MNETPKAFDYLFYSSYYNDLNREIGQNEALLRRHYYIMVGLKGENIVIYQINLIGLSLI